MPLDFPPNPYTGQTVETNGKTYVWTGESWANTGLGIVGQRGPVGYRGSAGEQGPVGPAGPGATVTVPTGTNQVVFNNNGSLNATSSFTHVPSTGNTVIGGTEGRFRAGLIDNTPIGTVTANTGRFTSLTATGTVDLSPAAGQAVTIRTTGTTGTGVTISSSVAGTINNMSIGETTPAAGQFTTLTANSSGSVTLTPTGAGTVTIKPNTAGAINNMSIGQDAGGARAGSFTTLAANSLSANFIQFTGGSLNNVTIGLGLNGARDARFTTVNILNTSGQTLGVYSNEPPGNIFQGNEVQLFGAAVVGGGVAAGSSFLTAEDVIMIGTDSTIQLPRPWYEPPHPSDTVAHIYTGEVGGYSTTRRLLVTQKDDMGIVSNLQPFLGQKQVYNWYPTLSSSWVGTAPTTRITQDSNAFFLVNQYAGASPITLVAPTRKGTESDSFTRARRARYKTTNTARSWAGQISEDVNCVLSLGNNGGTASDSSQSNPLGGFYYTCRFGFPESENRNIGSDDKRFGFFVGLGPSTLSPYSGNAFAALQGATSEYGVTYYSVSTSSDEMDDTVETIRIPGGHRFTNNLRVKLTWTPNTAITGLTQGGTYFLNILPAPDTDKIQLKLTTSGAVVGFTKPTSAVTFTITVTPETVNPRYALNHIGVGALSDADASFLLVCNGSSLVDSRSGTDKVTTVSLISLFQKKFSPLISKVRTFNPSVVGQFNLSLSRFIINNHGYNTGDAVIYEVVGNGSSIRYDSSEGFKTVVTNSSTVSLSSNPNELIQNSIIVGADHPFTEDCPVTLSWSGDEVPITATPSLTEVTNGFRVRLIDGHPTRIKLVVNNAERTPVVFTERNDISMTIDSGSLPLYSTTNNVYYVYRVDSDRIMLALTEADALSQDTSVDPPEDTPITLEFTTAGARGTGTIHAFRGSGIDIERNVFTIPNHGFFSNTPAIYNPGIVQSDGTFVGSARVKVKVQNLASPPVWSTDPFGLSSSVVYYATRIDKHSLMLANTILRSSLPLYSVSFRNGASTVDGTFSTKYLMSLSDGSNTVYNPFKNGDAVFYVPQTANGKIPRLTSGTLANGPAYYVRTFNDERSSANTNRNRLALASSYLNSINPSQTVRLSLDTRGGYVTFNPYEQLDIVTNLLSIPNHGFVTGTPVRYFVPSGSTAPTLSNNTTVSTNTVYFAYAQNSRLLGLTTVSGNAATLLDFTNQGVGTNHAIYPANAELSAVNIETGIITKLNHGLTQQAPMFYNAGGGTNSPLVTEQKLVSVTPVSGNTSLADDTITLASHSFYDGAIVTLSWVGTTAPLTSTPALVKTADAYTIRLDTTDPKKIQLIPVGSNTPVNFTAFPIIGGVLSSVKMDIYGKAELPQDNKTPVWVSRLDANQFALVDNPADVVEPTTISLDILGDGRISRQFIPNEAIKLSTVVPNGTTTVNGTSYTNIVLNSNSTVALRNTIYIPGHRFVEGEAVTVCWAGATAPATASPALAVTIDNYRVRLVSGDPNRIRLATTAGAIVTFSAVTATQMVITDNKFTINNHGFDTEMPIVYASQSNPALGYLQASALALFTSVAFETFYCRDVTSNTFRLALTPTGSAVTILSLGNSPQTAQRLTGHRDGSFAAPVGVFYKKEHGLVRGQILGYDSNGNVGIPFGWARAAGDLQVGGNDNNPAADSSPSGWKVGTTVCIPGSTLRPYTTYPYRSGFYSSSAATDSTANAGYIKIKTHGFVTSQPVMYHCGIATPVGVHTDTNNTSNFFTADGANFTLTNRRIYYVIRIDDDTIRLAVTPENAFAGVFIRWRQTSNTVIGGVTDQHSLTAYGSSTHAVVSNVTTNTFRLHININNWSGVSNTPPLDYNIIQGYSTGKHKLIQQAVSSTTSGLPFEGATNVHNSYVILKSGTNNARIYSYKHGLNTGDAVTYFTGGSGNIGFDIPDTGEGSITDYQRLESGQLLYAIRVNDNEFGLAKNYTDAVLGNYLHLIDEGVSGGVKNTPATFNPTTNEITMNNHGFADGDIIYYSNTTVGYTAPTINRSYNDFPDGASVPVRTPGYPVLQRRPYSCQRIDANRFRLQLISYNTVAETGAVVAVYTPVTILTAGTGAHGFTKAINFHYFIKRPFAARRYISAGTVSQGGGSNVHTIHNGGTFIDLSGGTNSVTGQLSNFGTPIDLVEEGATNANVKFHTLSYGDFSIAALDNMFELSIYAPTYWHDLNSSDDNKEVPMITLTLKNLTTGNTLSYDLTSGYYNLNGELVDAGVNLPDYNTVLLGHKAVVDCALASTAIGGGPVAMDIASIYMESDYDIKHMMQPTQE